MGDVLVSILVLVAYLAISYLTGRLLVSWISSDPSVPIRTGASLLGGGALGLQLWLFGSIHVPWNRLTLLIPWLLAAIVSRRRFTAALADDWRRLRQAWGEVRHLDALALILAIAGVMIALTYLLNLLTQPITGNDAVAMWMYKAKLYFSHQAVDLQPIKSDIRRNLDYPPLFSLMVSTVYTLMERADDLVGKAINFLFFAAGTATFLAFVRTLVSRQLTVTLTFLLVAMPLFSFSLFSSEYMGWADYALGICMLVSLIFLLEAVAKDQPLSLLFALIFAAMAALIKNEGLTFLLLILALVGYRIVRQVARSHARPRLDSQFLVIGVLALLPVVLWQVYIRIQGIEPALVSHRHWGELLRSLPGRAVDIVKLNRPLASWHLDYPWMAVSFVLTGLVLWVRRPHFAAWAYIAVLGQGLAYFVAYLLTPYDVNYIVSFTLGRLLLQLAPCFVLLVPAVLSYPQRRAS